MNKSLRSLYYANVLFVLGATLIGPLYAIFAEGFDVSVQVISYLGATLLISSVAGMIMVRWIGDRFTSDTLFIAGLLLRAIAWLSLAFATTLPHLFIIQIILGIGEAVGSPGYLAIYAKHLNDKHGVSLSATFQMSYAIVGTVGTLAGGWIVSNFGFPPLFIAMATIAIISIGVYLVNRTYENPIN